jgi:RNA polymerase sigma-70 factor (ECF subfamily)
MPVPGTTGVTASATKREDSPHQSTSVKLQPAGLPVRGPLNRSSFEWTILSFWGPGKACPAAPVWTPAPPSVTLVNETPCAQPAPQASGFFATNAHADHPITVEELEPHPDVALVERVRGGDVSAYDTLVRKYERQLFRIAQHITQNREDAEDVMQDAFLKAYEKLEQFQGNSKFYTWLVRIAVNESLMRLRKRRTGKMVSIDEDIETEEGSVPRDLADWAPDPEQNYNQAELAEILRKTIQGLPQGFRIVFVLRDVEGLSTEETAETLGLSVPAVKSRLLRARLQLRERLSRYFRKKKELQDMGVEK